MTSAENESFQLEILIAGEVSGQALVLDDPLSFWGGFDPATGGIIDVHHPQFGSLVGQSILFIPRSRGSAGTPGAIAETLRNGTGPLAFVLGNRDVNIAIGAQVANRMYSMNIPVLQCGEEQMKLIGSGDQVSISGSGCLSIQR